jgi:hypothetical protein
MPAYAAVNPTASRPVLPRTRSQTGVSGNMDGSVASSHAGSASAAEVSEGSESQQETGSDSVFVVDSSTDESS